MKVQFKVGEELRKGVESGMTEMAAPGPVTYWQEDYPEKHNEDISLVVSRLEAHPEPMEKEVALQLIKEAFADCQLESDRNASANLTLNFAARFLS